MASCFVEQLSLVLNFVPQYRDLPARIHSLPDHPANCRFLFLVAHGFPSRAFGYRPKVMPFELADAILS